MTVTREERERGERLRAFVAAVEGKPVEWGVNDCSMWPAQWAVSETGREADWPLYASREEAHAIIEAAGGLAAVWESFARQLGLEECAGEMLPVGAVAVVDTRRYGHIGCILAFGNIGCFRMEVDPARPERQQGSKVWGLRRHTIVRAWTLP